MFSLIITVLVIAFAVLCFLLYRTHTLRQEIAELARKRRESEHQVRITLHDLNVKDILRKNQDNK